MNAPLSSSNSKNGSAHVNPTANGHGILSGQKAFEARTSSRRSIMDRLHSSVVSIPDLPVVDTTAVMTFDDPIAKFGEMLSFVGGDMHVVDSAEQVREILQAIPVFQQATRIASLVPEIVEGTVDVAAFDDPHALASLDWTIARGEFGIAENGAIWIDGDSMPHRVMIFIAQYLAIVVPKSQIINNMHEGYSRIGAPKPGFSVFVSGPSKTADIEQSLVIGAHGCRKLQVFVI